MPEVMSFGILPFKSSQVKKNTISCIKLMIVQGFNARLMRDW